MSAETHAVKSGHLSINRRCHSCGHQSAGVLMRVSSSIAFSIEALT
jgi:hypothetical protein